MPAEPEVTIAMRIPGVWEHPGELVEALPKEFRLTPESLWLPSGAAIDFGVMDADAQFAEIFRTSCRRVPTVEEQRKVDGYRVNVLLSGPGGSFPAARAMMEAAAAIIRAGGAGVFIDNCGLAHGGENWLDITDDGSSDAVSFAYVSIVRGQADAYTVGMHVMGLREIVMKRSDIEIEGFDIVEVIRYVCQGEKRIDDGHLICDLDGPRFRACAEASPPAKWPHDPMHNPFGRLRLVSLRDLVERN